MYGADTNPQDLQSDHGVQAMLPEVPENIKKIEIDGKEKKEEVKMRKPRVGVRPTTRCIWSTVPGVPIAEPERRGWHHTCASRPIVRSWA